MMIYIYAFGSWSADAPASQVWLNLIGLVFGIGLMVSA